MHSMYVECRPLVARVSEDSGSFPMRLAEKDLSPPRKKRRRIDSRDTSDSEQWIDNDEEDEAWEKDQWKLGRQVSRSRSPIPLKKSSEEIVNDNIRVNL